MKKFIQLKLKYLSRMILKKYKPKVVGITGSVGKSSAGGAVYAVLSSKFNIRKNIKNYNNEIGVPLTIIGEYSAGKSVWGWIRIFFKAGKLILFKDKDYPEILVLEMGVDRPGDMEYLNSITNCDIGIVTDISHSHLEYFGSVEKIKKEKEVLIKNLKKGGMAVINYDNKMARKISDKSKAKILTYGFDKGAILKAQELLFNFEKNKDISNLSGMSFKLNYEGSIVPVILPDMIGYNVIYAALAGACVGVSFDMNLVDIANALKSYKALPGRMSLIEGIKNTMIIDDTYNSSPQSSISALNIISKIKTKKRIKKYAVLGDMLELGSYSNQAHREVGEYLVKSGINRLITVGERSRDIARGARDAGLSDDYIFHFSNTREAGNFLQNKMKEGDLIFVKGSQGMRMELIVKEVMADPTKAEKLLVRQDREWV